MFETTIIDLFQNTALGLLYISRIILFDRSWFHTTGTSFLEATLFDSTEIRLVETSGTALLDTTRVVLLETT